MGGGVGGGCRIYLTEVQGDRPGGTGEQGKVLTRLAIS